MMRRTALFRVDGSAREGWDVAMMDLVLSWCVGV
jgi:hypothetical protein